MAHEPDPAVLAPWNRVGDIRLGEPRDEVVAEYGRQGPYGYRLHGGRVGVGFLHGRVDSIGFSTRYYRTRNGFGVGSRIPYGPCVQTPAPVGTTRCGHRWHGFLWNEFVKEKPCHCWVKVGLGKRSLRPSVENYLKPWFFIYLRHGRVSGFYFSLHFVD